MEEHGAAIADASMSFPLFYTPQIRHADEIAKAIEINPSYAKAYYRRGLSYLAILRPTDAVKSFKSALKLDPANTAIRSQLDATIKLVRRIEFEKVSTSTSSCLLLHSFQYCPPSRRPLSLSLYPTCYLASPMCHL